MTEYYIVQSFHHGAWADTYIADTLQEARDREKEAMVITGLDCRIVKRRNDHGEETEEVVS